MSDGEVWSLVVLSSPLVSGTVACLLGRRGPGRSSTLTLGVVAALVYLLAANLFVGKPDEWALFLIVSIPWCIFFLVAAVVGDAIGRVLRNSPR